MNPPYCFVLIHSPLVGPLTWSRVARSLHARRVEAWAPALREAGPPSAPYWQRHAQSVADFIMTTRPRTPIVLAAHSGAGPLLPAIRAACEPQTPTGAYLFVDAGVPLDGHSRLDLMRDEAPEWAEEFGHFLEAGGRFPDWTDAQLQSLVPDGALRAQLLRELQPRGLDFFAEPLPIFRGWPDAPCGYIRFSQAYHQPHAQALRRGWARLEHEAGHFHMLVEPDQVTDMLLAIAARL
jgi:hypothetical protein